MLTHTEPLGVRVVFTVHTYVPIQKAWWLRCIRRESCADYERRTIKSTEESNLYHPLRVNITCLILYRLIAGYWADEGSMAETSWTSCSFCLCLAAWYNTECQFIDTRVWPDGKHVSCTVRFASSRAANFVFRNAYLFSSPKHNFQLYTPANHGTYGIRMQDGRLTFEVSQLRHDMPIPVIYVCAYILSHTYIIRTYVCVQLNWNSRITHAVSSQ